MKDKRKWKVFTLSAAAGSITDLLVMSGAPGWLVGLCVASMIGATFGIAERS